MDDGSILTKSGIGGTNERSERRCEYGKAYSQAEQLVSKTEGGYDPKKTHPTMAGVEFKSLATCGIEGTNVPDTNTEKYSGSDRTF